VLRWQWGIWRHQWPWHQGTQRVGVGLGVDGPAGEVLRLHHLRMRGLLLALQAVPVRMRQAGDLRHHQARAVRVPAVEARDEGALLLQSKDGKVRAGAW